MWISHVVHPRPKIDAWMITIIVISWFITVFIFITAFVLAWGPEDHELKVVSFKGLTIHWTITQAINNWVMFINCHRKQGFKMFYKEMIKIADEMHSLNITVNSWAFKRNHIILLLSALAFASVNFSLKLWDLSTDQYMDPLFGPTWNSRNNSYELYITVKVCTQTVHTLMITKMVFFPVSFISASYYCWHMLSKFNKHFSEQVELNYFI